MYVILFEPNKYLLLLLLLLLLPTQLERSLKRTRRKVREECCSGDGVIDCQRTIINWWISVKCTQDANPLSSSVKTQYVGPRWRVAVRLIRFQVSLFVVSRCLSYFRQAMMTSLSPPYWISVRRNSRRVSGRWLEYNVEKRANCLTHLVHFPSIQWWANPKSMGLYHAKNLQFEGIQIILVISHRSRYLFFSNLRALKWIYNQLKIE